MAAFYEVSNDNYRATFKTQREALNYARRQRILNFNISKMEIEVNSDIICRILSGDGYVSKWTSTDYKDGRKVI